MQRLTGQLEQVDHGVALLGLNLAAKVTNGLRRLGHAVALALQRALHELAVALHDGLRVVAGGAKVQQHDAVGAAFVAVVGKVGVGLDLAKLEQLAKQQTPQQLGDAVALSLRGQLQRFNRQAFDVVHGEDVGA